MDINKDIIDGLKDIDTAIGDKFSDLKKENAELYDRMQELEQKGAPGRSTLKPSNKGFRKYHSAQGPVYEIDADTKCADVLETGTPEISFDRWLGATVAGEKCEDKAALDYIREIKSVATTSTGVNIPTEYITGWIDNIRARSVLQRAGVITVPMATKVVSYSRQTGDPTAGWHEEAASISATDPTFVSANLTSKTIVCRTQVTLEAMEDSPNFGGQLANAMFGAMAAEIDRAGLHGSGASGEPDGILGQSGVLTVASVGTPTNYSEMLDGLKTLLDNNLPLEAIDQFAIMSPATWKTYQDLATGISSDNTPLERPQALRDTQFLVTSNVSDVLGSPETSAIFMGDFSSVIMGIRMNPSFKILELDTYAGNLIYEVVAVQRVDFMLSRPASLCTLTGVEA